MQQITKNVYTDTTIRGCNPSIVFTSEGSVFVDTAQILTKLLEMRKFALERGPIRYLINTEAHIDHIFGNHWFANEAITIGHEKLENDLWKVPGPLDAYDYSIDVLTRQDPEGLKQMPSREDYIMMKRPDITFSDHMSLKLGDTHFEIYHTPGHSACQAAVYVPEERVALLGDTLFVDCQTWLHSADIDALLKSLDFVDTLDVDYLIPGHGPVVTKEYIAKQRAFIYEWLGAVGAGISKGWSVDECADNISFADRCPMDIGQPEMMEYVQVNNVIKCYNYLMGTNHPLRLGAN